MKKPFGASLSLQLNNVCDNVPVEVSEGLFLGSIHSAFNEEELVDQGITHIINASGTPPTFTRVFSYLEITLKDKATANLLACLPAANLFIETAFLEGGHVLVHCQGGRSRSVSIVVAYLMSAKGYDFESAVSKIKALRPIIEINEGFVRQLRAYGEQGCDVYAAHQQILRFRLQEAAERHALYLLQQQQQQPTNAVDNSAGGSGSNARSPTMTMKRCTSSEEFMLIAEKKGSLGIGRDTQGLPPLPPPLPLPSVPRAAVAAAAVSSAWEQMEQDSVNDDGEDDDFSDVDDLSSCCSSSLASSRASSRVTTPSHAGNLASGMGTWPSFSPRQQSQQQQPPQTTQSATTTTTTTTSLPTLVMRRAPSRELRLAPALSVVQEQELEHAQPQYQQQTAGERSNNENNDDGIREGNTDHPPRPRPRPGPLVGFGSMAGDAPSGTTPGAITATAAPIFSFQNTRTPTGTTPLGHLGPTSRLQSGHQSLSSSLTLQQQLQQLQQQQQVRQQQAPPTPQLRLTRPTTSAVQPIPHLQAFERGFCCRGCNKKLFSLGNVLILEGEKGGGGGGGGGGQQAQGDEDVDEVEQQLEEEEEEDEVALLLDMTGGGGGGGGGEGKQDGASLQKSQTSVQSPNSHSHNRNESSMSSLPSLDILQLDEGSGSGPQPSIHTHTRPTRLPSPLHHNQQGVLAAPNPPRAPRHHPLSRSGDGGSAALGAAAAAAAAGKSLGESSSGSAGPDATATAASTTTTPRALPQQHQEKGTLHHFLPSPRQPMSRQQHLRPSHPSFSGSVASAVSTPRSNGSRVYRPASAEQRGWLACMRALEEVGGGGERALRTIEKDVAACYKIRCLEKKWIPVEPLLSWMGEKVVQEQSGLLSCPQCKNEVGRWDWNVDIGSAAAGGEQEEKAQQKTSLPFFGIDKNAVKVAPSKIGQESIGSSSGIGMTLSLSDVRLSRHNSISDLSGISSPPGMLTPRGEGIYY